MAKHNANKTRRGKKSTVKKVVKSARKSRKNAIFGGDFHNNSKNNETGVPSFVKNIYNVLGILKDMINYNTDKNAVNRDNRTIYKWDFGIGINDDKVQRFKNYMIELKKNISEFVKDDVLDKIKFDSYKNRVVNRRDGKDVDKSINYSFGAKTIGKYIDQTTLTSIYGIPDINNAITDNELKIRIIRLFYLLLSSKYIFGRIPVENRKMVLQQEAIRQILIKEYESVKTKFSNKSPDADYWIVHNSGKETPDANDPYFEFKFGAPTKLLGNKRPGFIFKVRENRQSMNWKNYETKDHLVKDTIAF